MSEKHGNIPVSTYAIQGIFLPIGINIGTDIGKNINIKVYSSISGMIKNEYTFSFYKTLLFQ